MMQSVVNTVHIQNVYYMAKVQNPPSVKWFSKSGENQHFLYFVLFLVFCIEHQYKKMFYSKNIFFSLLKKVLAIF